MPDFSLVNVGFKRINQQRNPDKAKADNAGLIKGFLVVSDGDDQ